MKRARSSLLVGGSATILFSVAGILAPGCEAVIRDPRVFFRDNPCNIFNCDNLAFLAGEQDQLPDNLDAPGPDTDK